MVQPSSGRLYSPSKSACRWPIHSYRLATSITTSEQAGPGAQTRGILSAPGPRVSHFLDIHTSFGHIIHRQANALWHFANMKLQQDRRKAAYIGTDMVVATALLAPLSLGLEFAISFAFTPKDCQNPRQPLPSHPPTGRCPCLKFLCPSHLD